MTDERNDITPPPEENDAAPGAEEMAERDRDEPVESPLSDLTARGHTAEPDPSEETSEPEEPQKSMDMDWFVLKVQSNREKSIRDGLKRRIAVAGLDRYFGDILVPTEKVTEVKGGKKRVTERKLYPGYIVVEMEANDDTWFLVRETPGIGDFTGSRQTTADRLGPECLVPMQPHEVARLVAKQEEEAEEVAKLKIGFAEGDRVKINDGTFENFEGEVEKIDETSGRVVVTINIFGRSTPVELEYWQVENV